MSSHDDDGGRVKNPYWLYASILWLVFVGSFFIFILFCVEDPEVKRKRREEAEASTAESSG